MLRSQNQILNLSTPNSHHLIVSIQPYTGTLETCHKKSGFSKVGQIVGVVTDITVFLENPDKNVLPRREGIIVAALQTSWHVFHNIWRLHIRLVMSRCRHKLLPLPSQCLIYSAVDSRADSLALSPAGQLWCVCDTEGRCSFQLGGGRIKDRKQSHGV